MNRIFVAFCLVLALSSCTSKFQKILKNKDNDYKVKMAESYFLQKNYSKDLVSFADNLIIRNDNLFQKKPVDNLIIAKKSARNPKDILSLFSKSDKLQLIAMAKNNITSTDFSIQNSKLDLDNKSKTINSHWLAIHEKFVIAYSCLLMFFIGQVLVCR